jgi:dihydropteroate synthase
MLWTSPHGRPLPDWRERTLLMGILNVTPDSFSDGGVWSEPEAAAERAAELHAAGADVIDIGAESTRPGANPVEEAEELRRLLPAIRAVRARLPQVPISADTYRPKVAEAAIAAGADMLNDVWGGVAVAQRPSLATVAAACRCPWILMHNRERSVYADFWPELLADLRSAIARAEAAGVARSQLWIDPGFGFGKDAELNLEVLGRLSRVTSLGLPVLLGTSRKSTLGRVLGEPDPMRRGAGDAATAAWGIAQGAAMLRVHDIAALRPVAKMADALRAGRQWRAG